MSLSSSVTNATLNIAKTQYSDGTSQTTAYVPLNVVGVSFSETKLLNTSPTGALTTFNFVDIGLPFAIYRQILVCTLQNTSTTVTGNISIVYDNTYDGLKYYPINNLILPPQGVYQFTISDTTTNISTTFFNVLFKSTDATAAIYVLKVIATLFELIPP
jgi:hypothetical protein